MAAIRDSSVIFDHLSTKFTKLLYARSEGDSELIHETLEELNNLNYKHHITINPTKAVLLINQCCTLVQPDDDTLVSKCCRLITNLVTHQHLQLEGITLKVTVDWCMNALKQVDKLVMLEVLITIDALLRIDARNTKLLLKDLFSNSSPLVLLAQNTSQEELATFATQCLEACTITKEELQSRLEITSCIVICAKVFLDYLNGDKNFRELLHYKMLVSCLCGLYNIISQDVEFLNNHLGILLGIVRSYMLYGVKGVEFIKPQKLLPSQLSIPESTICTLREKKGGKVPKLRKSKTGNADKKLESNFDSRKEYLPATIDLDTWTDSSNKVKTSDSELSDSETATVAKITYLQRKIRQASLNLFLKITKTMDKRTMFSYWSSFIPDGSPSGIHSICTCILKEPSPSTRSMALNVLLTLLSTSKLFLSQAESSEKSTAFTPFSVTLGSMILEMHRCLRFALNENSIPVLMQVLRCLAELVQASPYPRLTPGTITKVVRSVKVFLDHKDSGIQIRALIVLGCILASEPVVPETILILSKCSIDKDKILGYTSGSASESRISPEDIEYANFSTDDEETEPEQVKTIREVPWILKVCLRCLGVVINSAGDCIKSNYTVSPLVKLEALQVLQAIPRNYFMTLIAPYLHHIAKALGNTLTLKSERQTDIKLHAGSTLDSIGQAMSSYFVNNPDKSYLSIDQGLIFWNNLLGGPLSTLISNEEHPMLRAVGCDCLGSIGADIFERLTKDKQMLVIMSLLGCSRDEESNVRGAAVRALAISVVYPSLREDSGFILDTAETICRTVQDSNVTVRGKASWSLANFSSALVLNKDNPNVIEDVPEKLLIDLIYYSIKGCKDNDRVKANTVRALGDLLQLLSKEQLKKEEFKNNCLEGIKSLINCASIGSNMKVRWNSCHSLGKILKNEAIYIEVHHWQKSMFDNLTNLVVGFKHFKVRISAAFALSCISKKSSYGAYYFTTWRALLKALENSENMEDFTEYKHRDNLVDQICLSIGHLTTLLTIEDIHFLQEDVVFYSDLLKCNIQKVYDRVVPEKASGLVSAEEHLRELLPNVLSNEQKQTLDSLIKAFHIDKI